MSIGCKQIREKDRQAESWGLSLWFHTAISLYVSLDSEAALELS